MLNNTKVGQMAIKAHIIKLLYGLCFVTFGMAFCQPKVNKIDQLPKNFVEF